MGSVFVLQIANDFSIYEYAPNLYTQWKMLTAFWYFKLSHKCDQNPWHELYFIIYGFLLSLYLSSCSFMYIAETWAKP